MKRRRIDTRSLERAEALLTRPASRPRVIRELLREAAGGDGGQAFYELAVATSAVPPGELAGDAIPETLETAWQAVRESGRPDQERAEALRVLGRFRLARPLPALDVAPVVERAFLAATGFLGPAPGPVARAGAQLLMEWDMDLLLEGTELARDRALRANVRPRERLLLPACRRWHGRLRDEDADEAERAAAGVLLLAVRRVRVEKGLELQPLVEELLPALGSERAILVEIWRRAARRLDRSRRALYSLGNIDLPDFRPAGEPEERPGRRFRGRIRPPVIEEAITGYEALLPAVEACELSLQAPFASGESSSSDS